MRCQACDYPLWNLTTRVCPECGRSFLPSDFEFVPGAVRFCCPGCTQAYYGTDSRGHLVPRAFACVTCGDAIEMDRMVLLPNENAPEHLVEKAAVPWLATRRHGVIGAFFSTMGWAMVKPRRLGQTLPLNAAPGRAILFAVLILLMMAAISAAPVLLFALVPARAGMSAALVPAATAAGVVLVVGIVLLLAWGCSAHLLLRLTGRVAGPLGSTVEALCYAMGSLPVAAVVSFCAAPYLSWVWPAVSGAIALSARQRVAGWRAALATLALPLATIAMLMMAWAYVTYRTISTANAMAGAAAMPPPAAYGTGRWSLAQSPAVNALQSYMTRTGTWPGHGAELLLSGGLTPADFIAPGSMTDPSRVYVGGAMLESLVSMPTARSEQALAAAAAANAGRPAHRVGDIVFTYTGQPSPVPASLWIAIVWPDPGQNSVPPEQVVVMTAFGTQRIISAEEFDDALQAQNATRLNQGYAALPHPKDVAAEPPPTVPEDG